MKDEINNILRTLQAVGPILGNALRSGQLFNPQAELTEPDPDILCEYDVEIPVLSQIAFLKVLKGLISIFGIQELLILLGFSNLRRD